MALYLDSSAIVKLVVRETESTALRRFLRTHPVRVSSALARIEVLRAVRGHGEAARERARDVLKRLVLLAIDDRVIEQAAGLDGRVLRSLDAIHGASALQLGDEIVALVTYDERMQDAARAMGIPMESPA